MRPADEHQGKPTRPNFMSASRHSGAGHDNILARLERGSGRQEAGWSMTGKVGAGGAVLFTLLLLWLLTFLTRERQQVHAATPVAIVMPAPVAPIAVADPPAVAPAPASASVEIAAYVPIVPAALTRIAPAPPPAMMIARNVRPAPSAARQPRTAQARVPTRAGHGQAQGAARTAGASRDGDNGIDKDVALLSAILLHSPRHSAERMKAERRCNGDKTCLDAMTVPLTD